MSPPPAPAAPQRVAQNTAGRPLEAATATDAAAVPAPTTNIGACDKPGGMGLSRVVEIDTTGGPGFGFEHFKQYDFLRPNEVVLTFDDGPWPVNTPAVLKALADDCLKATFFEIGEHAIWHPEIAKQVAVAGNTIGSHTWSHKDLARNPYASDIEQAKQEIEMGVSAVHAAVGGPQVAAGILLALILSANAVESAAGRCERGAASMQPLRRVRPSFRRTMIVIGLRWRISIARGGI